MTDMIIAVESSSKESGKIDGRAGPVLSEREAEYLAENMIGRVATVSPSMQPHVVPVTYRFDGTSVFFGGWNLTRSLKFRNLSANGKVAFVVDDIVSTRPWRVRGLEVRGKAEPVVTEEGATIVKITPNKVRSWGLEE
ncbi:MAG: PPOX class F420-dependent oxidoreductase [Nitrososphaerales archaeon]|nr:PPOX class F420-dependent oxidoreductase [Nitrososphaerales archaeon]